MWDDNWLFTLYRCSFHIHAIAKCLYYKNYDSMAPLSRWLFLAIVRKLHSILNILCTICYTNFKNQSTNLCEDSSPPHLLYLLHYFGLPTFIQCLYNTWPPTLLPLPQWSPFQYRPLHFLPTSPFYPFSPIFTTWFYLPRFLKSCSNLFFRWFIFLYKVLFSLYVLFLYLLQCCSSHS